MMVRGVWPAVAALVLVVAGSAGSVAAQIAVPEACSPILTTHKDSCEATTIFQCSDGYLTHTYISGDLVGTHTYDAQWVLKDFVSVQAGSQDARFELIGAPSDTAGVQHLIATGSSRDDREGIMNTRVIRDRMYQIVNEVSLSDETITLDGLTFRKAKSDRVFTLNGREAFRFVYDVYVSEDPLWLLEGSYERSTFGSAAERLAFDPISVRVPGTEGFLADRSDFGCT